MNWIVTASFVTSEGGNATFRHSTESMNRAIVLAVNEIMMAVHDAIPAFPRGNPAYLPVQRAYDLLASGDIPIAERLDRGLKLWQEVLALAPGKVPPSYARGAVLLDVTVSQG